MLKYNCMFWVVCLILWTTHFSNKDKVTIILQFVEKALHVGQY